ncbi:hypothetical protein PCASD_11606 [Puccinia coronata f. sp. avenae]|uniref:Far11/STRP C-terminal domain-containing protein n=1 Tax=Puccinia coronata f. sp. avenae TaxID=200324 RepID=A0A2N5U8S2_9BASI|nr:hypothetical protein PCASD_11606 [Puccinia coronata f. sp. avenae]
MDSLDRSISNNSVLQLDITSLEQHSQQQSSPSALSPGELTSQPYTNPVFLNRRSSSVALAFASYPASEKPWHGGPGRTTVSGGGGPQGRDIIHTQLNSNHLNPKQDNNNNNNNNPLTANPIDQTNNITLNQLKANKATNKERPSIYDFPSAHLYPPHIPSPNTPDHQSPPATDCDTLTNELDEFYSYVEVPGVLEGRDTWELDPTSNPQPARGSTYQKLGSTRNWREWSREKLENEVDWVQAPPTVQRSYIIHLLDRLEDKDPEIRFDAARKILYIAQGTFAHSTSTEHHVQLVIQNAKLLREVGALEAIFVALKGVGGRHDWISSLPEAPDPNSAFSPPGPYLDAHDRQAFLEEINGELAIHLAVLYFMVEVFRGDETWGEELMGLDPPLPIYMLGLVAGLREKNAKGYPVKKLLLLLWKSLLVTLGGIRDVDRVKKMVRSIESLPPNRSTPASSFKVSPLDFYTFRKEIITKYPTYVPSDPPEMYLARLAAAAAPTPIRPSAMYHPANSTIPHDPSGQIKILPNNNLQPGTPAPSPPPSPQQKLKKQQFQTDQTRPFVLPFSAANAKVSSSGVPSLVPRSIDEAGELYMRHLRISTELWQTWKVREEFMADESGLAKVEACAEANSNNKSLDRDPMQNITDRMTSMTMDQSTTFPTHIDERPPLPDSLQMLIELEERIWCDFATAEQLNDHETAQKLKQDALDTRKLQRVELLYRSILPQMQSAVIVLLKLLLATVTANNNANNSSEGEQQKPPPTIEDIDILRHREITSKAVSAILILTLKWFKASHVMKFHYLAQLLVDSNCLLLILKMFGLQEVGVQVKTKNECEDYNFFRYCALYGSRFPTEACSKESVAPKNSAILLARPTPLGDEEVEVITDYSWRNFFSAINFVHILQKLTKGRVHRILLLVQYKSSAILKRILRANQPTLQLYVLKVLKSQVPFCGRKWRQANMKVITAIYLNCRANLRDEWLLGVDLDGEVEDSFPQEQALRSLVSFYNCKHYSAFAHQLYRRPSSLAANPPDGPTNNAHAGSHPADRQGGLNGLPPSQSPQTSSESDVFPPMRSFYDHTRSSDPSTAIVGCLEDYEVESLFYPHYSVSSNGLLERSDDAATSAWNRLGELLGDFDDISDSESIASIEYLGGEFGSDGGVSSQDDGDQQQQQNRRAEWEHLSPETITALEEERKTSESHHHGSPSPIPRRKKSSEPKSPALRPVVFDGREDDDDNHFDPERLPLNRDLSTTSPRRSPHFGPQSPLNASHHSGPAVDEVELIFGE